MWVRGLDGLGMWWRVVTEYWRSIIPWVDKNLDAFTAASDAVELPLFDALTVPQSRTPSPNKPDLPLPPSASPPTLNSS